jgi:hypothetical protein
MQSAGNKEFSFIVLEIAEAAHKWIALGTFFDAFRGIPSLEGIVARYGAPSWERMPMCKTKLFHTRNSQ